MKKIMLFFLIFFVIFFGKSVVYSADSSATFSLTYSTPISIQEIRPFTLSLTKKSGINPTQSVSVPQGGLSTYFSSRTVQTGCFKVTGEANANVRINSITPSPMGPISISSSPRVIVGDSCNGVNYHEALPKSFTLNSNGERYIIWGFTYYQAGVLDNFDVPVNFSHFQDGSWSATAAISIQYN